MSTIMMLLHHIRQAFIICVSITITIIVYHSHPSWIDEIQRTPPSLVEEKNSQNPPVLMEPQNEHAIPRPNSVTDKCTPNERLTRLKNSCHENKTYIWSLLSDQALRLFTNELTMFVDERHEMMLCVPPKSGCTTWKSILANNSANGPLPKNFNMRSLHFNNTLRKKYGIKMLEDYSTVQIRFFLKNFYKFIVVRHPLERIYSAYVNKLLSGTDVPWQRNLGKKILKAVGRSRDVPLADQLTGKGVQFQEFIWYIKKFNVIDFHWGPLRKLCQPCMIGYDKIVKLETHYEDSYNIITDRLAPTSYGLHFHANKVLGGAKSGFMDGHFIPAYANLTSEEIQFLTDLFREDMDMFGYTFSGGPQGELSLYCNHGSPSRSCC